MLASISSWSYRSLFEEGATDLLSFVDEVHRQGADGLEIFPRHVNPDDPAGHLSEVARKAGSLGLEVSAVIAANDFARPLATERAEQVERMEEWIRHTASAGIERMNTFTGYHTSGDDPLMEVHRVIDAYREVMPLAEQRDVVLCIENHSSVCRDADGVLAVIRAVGSPNLRTNPDFTNFVQDFRNRSERSLEAVYTETEKVAPLAANAHLKVGDFTDEGEHAYVDVGRLIGILRETGYDGHVALEYYGRDDPVEACAKGIALLRRYIPSTGV
ncbi:MAG: sugar phosphate isomerase/epimerase family protein [Candidatus Brocadiaceae bacterium]|jgi:sugar phosphate isomerase/epimerase